MIHSTENMAQETATILWNQRINPGYGRIGLACGFHYVDARPGQFVTLRFPDQRTPLLRRPFSIHRLIGRRAEFSGIEILYKIVGKFTQALSQIKQGDRIDLVGPLGRGFTISENYHKVAFIAGGIGVAPLVFLSEYLSDLGIRLDTSAAFIGGRSQTDILCKSAFKDLNINLFTVTEDGSEGEAGLVVAPLSRWLKTKRPDMIYACGPMPMLKAVIAISRLEKLPCEVSIETIMACGMGACLGCAIQTNQDFKKYKHVCMDGPVFDSAELVADSSYSVT
jgi:dihydroorotate dehydrogenase electron transfer subunit